MLVTGRPIEIKADKKFTSKKTGQEFTIKNVLCEIEKEFVLVTMFESVFERMFIKDNLNKDIPFNLKVSSKEYNGNHYTQVSAQ
jgi:hypothetical protein